MNDHHRAGMLARAAAVLPKGRGLPPAVWEARHRVILVILWLHVFGIFVFALARGFTPQHAMFEAFVVLVPTFWATVPRGSRLWRTLVATAGLLFSSAVLVHESGGSTVMHFHFFVMVPVVALYQEWLPFLFAIGFVAIHHTVFGTFSPHDVFDTNAAWHEPWKWALIHAVFVLGASAASVASWKLNESAREQAEFVLNAAAEGFFVVDERGRCTFVNQAGADLLGYDAVDLVLGPIDALHPHAEGDATGCAFCRPSALTEPVHGDAELRRRDGSTVAVEFTATSVEAGARWVGIVTCKDVTEKKRVEAALVASEKRFRSVTHSAPDAIVSSDEHGNIASWNSGAERLFGWTAEEAIGRSLTTLMPARYRDAHSAGFARRAATGDGNVSSVLEVEAVRRDGTEVAVELSLSDWVLDGRRQFTAIMRDVTERKLAEAALAREAGYVRLLSDIATAANEANNTTQALQSALGIVCRGSGWTLGHVYLVEHDRLVPTSIWHVADGCNAEQLQLQTSRTIMEAGVGLPGRVLASGEPAWLADVPDDNTLPRIGAMTEIGIRTAVAFPVLVGSEVGAVIELFSNEHREADEQLVEVIRHIGAQLGRVLERQRAEEALSHQAMHDRLTGLPNRALFGDRLTVALSRAAARVGSVAVLFIDLDRFKLVNDSLGHAPGDQLLLAVAARLRAVIRPSDTVARLGGDEFTVVCENVSGQEEAIGIAERLADALSEPFVIDDSELFVTASIGIALSTGGEVDPDELLRDADAAMYRAKEQGRARWQLFNRDMRTAAVHRLETVNALHRALERGEFRVVYQPQVELATNRVVGMEALVRWDHPQRGEVGPVEFIPLAEESGLIHDLGAWVLEEACRQAKHWQTVVPAADGTAPLTMSVNLSPKQLQRSSLVSDVAAVLSATGLPPSSLVLELTESVLMLDADSIISRLEALRALGLRLAIDDFGTGYSSLSYLQRFPIDVLKIDRSFIDGLGADADHTAVARTIVRLGQSLRLETVAEGVERPEHLDHLRGLHCDAAQGYLFARPLPPEEAETLLELSASGLWSPGAALPAPAAD